VEAGLGGRTMPYRQASRLTGIGLSSLARHMTNHWSPPVEELSQPPLDKAVSPAQIAPGPHTSPCVIEVMDQAQLARLHAKKYPPVHSLALGWEQVLNGWCPREKRPASPLGRTRQGRR
jgi:hypothetical protein